MGKFLDDARRAGALVTDGPLPEDFTAAWGNVALIPLTQEFVAHYWTAARPEGRNPVVLYDLLSACGLHSIGTRACPLLGAGNLPFCARCETALLRAFRGNIALTSNPQPAWVGHGAV